MEFMEFIWATFAAASSFLIWRFLYKVWWFPRQLEQAFHKQGLRGPPRFGPLGNFLQLGSIRMKCAPEKQQLNVHNHDILGHVFPDQRWLLDNYGEKFLFWWATEPRVNINKPELIREVLSKSFDCYGKSPIQVVEFIVGTIAENGDAWAFHRKLAAPAFYSEKLKDMTGTFVDCTSRMLGRWDQVFADGKESEAEIEVNEEFVVLTGDAIAHVAFGGSYESTKRAFELLNLLTSQHLRAYIYSWIPFARWFPNKLNREIWKNEREVDQLVSDIIDERRAKVTSGAWSSYGDDFLGLIVAESERQNSKLDKKKVIGECKTMHIVGNDTTSTLLTWTLFLLAVYPEWQERLREEVVQVCGNQNPTSEMLAKLKQIAMVLNESLRLYPPVGLSYRACFKDVQLGDIHFPKGSAVLIPILALHHDKELWGEDVNEFNPRRFEQGAAKASKHPNAFMPFLYGPRICLGMNLSLIEAKVAVAMILQKFEFRVSPSYRHCPIHVLTLKPHNGMQLVFKHRDN